MKIAFDAKRAFNNRTGLGNYSRDTIRLLHRFYATDDYYLYHPKSIPNQHFALDLDGVNYRTPQKAFFKKFHQLWRSFGMIPQLKSDQIDIYHGLSNEIPAGLAKHGIRAVVSIHDLIFIRYPKLYPAFDRKMYRIKFKAACEQADCVIAISEQTKADIIYYFGIPEEKIKVVYQGCHPIFQEEITASQLQKVKEKFQLPNQFAFNVGTIEERKNLMMVLKTMKTLKHLHLVAVGKPTAYSQQLDAYIKKHGLENRVHFLSGLQLEELAALYRLATVFTYSSVFEGFGIPILEALYSGTPVIAHKEGVFPEVGGPDSIYVPMNDEAAWVAAIDKVINNDDLRKQMSDKGRIFAQRFNDDKIAENLHKLYKSLL